MANMNLSSFIVYQQLTERRNHRYHQSIQNVIESKYVTPYTFVYRYFDTGNELYLAAVANYIAEKSVMEEFFGELDHHHQHHTDPCHPSWYVDSRCMERKVNEFKELFGELTEARLQYVKIFGQECIKTT